VKGEIWRVTTEDCLELQGLFAAPDLGPGPVTVLHVHGLCGNFYENRFLDVEGEALVAQGRNFLPFNNRGHDYYADLIQTGLFTTKTPRHQENEGPEFTTETQPRITHHQDTKNQEPGTRNRAGDEFSSRRVGGVLERFADCRYDIQAFLDVLARRAPGPVILQGHSHGALKAAYYLAQTADPRIVALILLSPSDDLGVQRRKLGARFEAALDCARELLATGRPEALMPVKYFPDPLSAQTYLDTFGPDSPLALANVSQTDRKEFPELAAIRVPVLAAVGTVEEYFLGTPEAYLLALQARLTGVSNFTGYVAVGAPHNYLGHEAALARVIADWVSA
jgi:pimeloyl-ACP methyl ester carboxylesterase